MNRNRNYKEYTQNRISYFMSDAHLVSASLRARADNEIRLAEFFRFLEGQPCALYLVGDFFDFWFEYKSVIPKQCLFGITELLKLRDHGVEIHYLAGNHDGWLGRFAQNELDIMIYVDPIILRMGSKKILVLHGDGISGKDYFYRQMRRILRSSLNIWLYRWLHPDIGVPLANASSRWGKRSDPDFKRYADDPSIGIYLESWFRQGVDTIIMGHHHIPADKTFPGGRYVNLGDWTTHFTYAVFKDNDIQLKYWNKTTE